MPRLRFAEFRETGDWSKTEIGRIADIYRGKGIAKSDIAHGGKQLCIRYGELYTIYGEVIHDVLSTTNVPAQELFLSKANDVIIPASGETKEDIATASCVMRDGIALGGDLNVIRSPLNGVFLSYYMNGALSNNIARVAQGDSVVHLYPSQLKVLEISFPLRHEQQKIADCLTSLDDRIRLETERLNVLKDHKKGLMQQMFPAEGATVPRLRFAEFRDAGEWEEQALGDLGFFIRGLTYSAGDVSNDGLLVLRSSNIQDGSLILDRDLVFVSKDCPIDLLLQEGDLVICMSNGSKALVGKNAEYRGNGTRATTVGAFCSLFRPRTIFAKIIFQTEQYAKFVSESIGGGNINNLKNSHLESFVSLVPVISAEQQKIADCLSSLDDRIRLETERLNALKDHKKGLMQQLFPAVHDIAV